MSKNTKKEVIKSAKSATGKTKDTSVVKDSPADKVIKDLYADKTIASANKAIKVTKSTDKTAQLETFVASLGVTSKAELYLYNANAYININIILPILSVDLSWFVKNAEINTHYIKLSKGVYINKYGMTKLLGQSKEVISFKLQDYLYDIFYQVETKGSVTRSEIKSRDELIKAANLSDKLEDVTKELELYQTVEMSNRDLITNLSTSFEILKNDYAALDAENQILNDKFIDLQDDYKQLSIEHNHLQLIANALAKHVRIKKSNVPEAYDDNLDVEDIDTDTLDSTDEKKITDAAQTAKAKLTIMNKQKKTKTAFVNSTDKKLNPSSTKSSSKTNKPDKKHYAVLRSSHPMAKQYTTDLHTVDSDAYRWEVTDKQCDVDFKVASSDFIADEEYLVTDANGITAAIMPPPMLWYADISASDEKIKAINLFLQLSDFCCITDTIDQLIELI